MYNNYGSGGAGSYNFGMPMGGMSDVGNVEEYEEAPEYNDKEYHYDGQLDEGEEYVEPTEILSDN